VNIISGSLLSAVFTMYPSDGGDGRERLGLAFDRDGWHSCTFLEMSKKGGYSQRPVSKSSSIQRGAANVMGISASEYSKKASDSPGGGLHMQSPPQFKGRSKLANGITTKLLRYGTDGDKADRRKLLEEEKVLQLRAALLLSISRKPEKIDVEKLKKEIRKLENPEEEERDKFGAEVDVKQQLSPNKKKHHYELETEESHNHFATEGRKREVHEQFEEEYSPVHSHNMAHVRPFRAPNPYTDHTAAVAHSRLEAAQLDEKEPHKFDNIGEGTVAVISPEKSGLQHKNEPTRTEATAMSVALGDIKKGLANLKKSTEAPSPFKAGDLKKGLAGLKKVENKEEKPRGGAGEVDAKVKERKEAWEKFSIELNSSLSPSFLSSSLPSESTNGGTKTPERKLGDGKFGTAYLYRFSATQPLLGGDVVLKIASFGENDPNKSSAKVFKQSGTSDEARKMAPVALLAEFSREVKCLVALQHPNIMKFKGVLLPPAPLSLVTEFVSGGSLGQALSDTKNWKRVPTKQKMGVLKGILKGLNFMHARGFVHRDVKPHNILLAPSATGSDSSSGGGGDDDDGVVHQWVVAKIADFGTSVALGPGEKCTGEVGTTGYIAPEIVNPDGYDGAVDVFAFGVLGWEMFSGLTGALSKNPMIGKDPADLFEGPRPECGLSHPSSVLVMAKRAWQGDPSKRPSFHAISALFGMNENEL
jgi:hypothetical protein